jgi:hypothetical protein
MNAHLGLAGLVAAAIAASPMATDAQCRAQSADHQVALLELYTSEGCDSCPPADQSLSALRRGTDAQRAVALAFHVDYWDRLGWRDRFGSAAFTARQREQSTRHRTAFVYTPQVLLQGEDFSWRAPGQPAAAIAAINARAPRAKIELAAAPVEHNATAVDVRVRVPDARDRAHAAIALALVQDGLASDVKAGENAGKRLAHDRVVRQWHVDPARFDATGEAAQHVVLALPTDAGALSLVAFAEDASTGNVLQAVDLPLCGR